MRLDEKKFELVLSCIKSKEQRKILYYLKDDTAFNYTTLMNKIQRKTNVFAFHLRALKMANLVKVDQKHYFITRLGKQTIDLLEEYKALCSTFDISDCDESGMVQLKVIRS